MIACTNTQSFVEEGENCASTILVEHTLGYDMNLFVFDMTLFGSDTILISMFQYISLLLVAFLINFGVKNQVPKISFKNYAGDLMLVFFYEFDDIIFYGSLDIWK